MERRTSRSILIFWTPLAATWMMMAVEMPFLAAIIARLADPAFNLAAHGVAFAFALLIEAPVIMLMSASTALVEDATSYRRLRNFTHALNAGCTSLVPLVLAPPVYSGLMYGLLTLPPEVAELTRGALWLLLPWPAAIGYRRFYQGILIRAGRTRAVAIGTLLRLGGMATTGFISFAFLSVPGAWVGAASLSAGVCVEGIAARLMARQTINELLASEEPTTDGGSDGAELAMSYRAMASFYWPLALTSFIGLTVQPMLTFFMGRATAPIQSLAVFPVVHALSFLFRSLGLSYQEAAIALIGPRAEHAPELGRFALWLGLAASAGLALVAFTPLANFWFLTVSGLTPELAAFAAPAAMILVPFPALGVLLSYQRGVLVASRWTGHITKATALEVAVVGVLFVTFGWKVGMVGVNAAFLAHVGGRLSGTLYLLRPVRHALARLRGPSNRPSPARGGEIAP